MPYKITWESRGSVVECSGQFNMDQLHDANGRLHGHEDFDRHKYQIWNLLEADMSGVTEGQMVQPAATDSVAERYAPDMKVALVVMDEHARKLCEAYRKSTGKLGSRWECRLFECLDEARAWALA